MNERNTDLRSVTPNPLSGCCNGNGERPENPQGVDALLHALFNGSPNERLNALKGLTAYVGASGGRNDSERIIESLGSFFLSCNDEILLGHALKTLQPLGERLSKIFINRFSDLDINRKPWVLKFLAEIACADAIDVFTGCLNKYPLDLGVFAINGLASISSEASVKVLGLHADHAEWFLRKRIIEALGGMNVPQAVTLLIKAIEDPSVLVRTAAIESLSRVGHLDPEKLVGALMKADGEVRISLVRAMAQIRHKSFLKPMIDVLQDRSTLFFTIDALGEMGFPEAIPALARFLNDEEWFNRLNALEALAKLAGPEKIDYAKACKDDKNDMVRNAAKRVIDLSGK